MQQSLPIRSRDMLRLEPRRKWGVRRRIGAD
jgi:hypothetical protein